MKLKPGDVVYIKDADQIAVVRKVWSGYVALESDTVLYGREARDLYYLGVL